MIVLGTPTCFPCDDLDFGTASPARPWSGFVHEACSGSARFVLPLLAAVIVSFASRDAAAAGSISYWGTQPAGKPAFGQTVMITGIVSPPLGTSPANLPVQLWFSGRHGVRAATVLARTDRLGRFNVLMTIPHAWRYGIYGDPTWVDVTIACPSAGATRLFRVRNK